MHNGHGMKNTVYFIVGSIILALSGCSISSDSTNDTGSGTTATTTTDTSPSITLVGSSNMQVTIDDTFDDPGATADDDEDGNLTASITTSSTLDTSVAGTYIITYSVTDSDDNTTSTTRTVTVANDGDDYYVDWVEDFTLPEQDDDGWSIMTPSSDSQIVYVSDSEGNDDTAEVYTPGDETIGDDVFNPDGAILPYATLEAALDQMRDDYPDYVLLKRGDSWQDQSVNIATHGRSAAERSVLAAYGDDTDARPLVENSGVYLNNSGYLAVMGIHFRDNLRNPNSSEFVGFDDVDNAKGIGATLYNSYGGLLFEDCWFEWFGNNVIQSYSFDADNNKIRIKDIIVRRNIFNNTYSTVAHAQGLYSSHTSMLLEENIFDHNGWYQQGDASTKAEGKATMFNHNTYFPEASNTIFRKNLFLRASSIGNKFTSNTNDSEGISNQIRAWNILVDNNFYAEGEIGISIGGNKDQDDGPRWENILLTNNVLSAIGRTFPTSRTLGWGLETSDWKNGLVQNNLMVNWGEEGVYTNTWGLTSGGHMTNTLFDSNIIYNIVSGQGVMKFTDGDVENAHDNITYTNNEINLPVDTSGRVLDYSIAPETQFFGNNYYYFASDEDDWFRFPDISTATFSDYQYLTSDSTSVQEARNYVDPDRTVASYLEDMAYASGLDDDTEMDALVTLLKTQRKGNWDEDLTANALNDYFREGFCIDGNDDCR